MLVIPNSLCFSTWELRSLSKQWTHGPTLMLWRYHLLTALRLFKNLSRMNFELKIYDVEFCTQNWPVLLETQQVKLCFIVSVGVLKERRNKKEEIKK